ncbi:MAG: HAMP domain-containing sensor histidine kinase [Candidatus Absconditabacteria bacterium]
MFKNLRTSTQIGLKFTIYTIIQIIIFAIFANIVFFYKWYNMETERLNNKPFYQNKIEKRQENNLDRVELNQIDDNQKLPEYFPRKIQFFEENSYLGNQILENKISKKISKIDSNYYMFNNINGKILVSDISPHINMQINLIYISIILLFLLSALAYIFSITFVKSSLKKINELNEFLDKLDINNLNKKIEINGHIDDEINKLSNKFNQVLDKLNIQTNGLKDFIKNASHEIKTPLMVINSELDYAKKSKNYVNSLDNIKDQIKSLGKLIDTLIEITKFETTDNLTIGEINIVQDTKTIIDNIQSIYPQKNISVNVEAKDNCIVKGFTTSWNIIFKNLLDNSFKYSKDGSIINIHISNEKFVIKDQGVGISSENIDYIWDRFWQGDKSNSDVNSYGLGLHLVKLLVDKNKWKIEVKSIQGEGTTFTINFM